MCGNTGAMTKPPTVFISYSHDSDAHKKWVIQLATDMRSKGVDVILDHWDLKFGQDLAMFMQQGVSKSDRVLMICTATYVQKSEERKGGVGFEALIVTGELVQTIETAKFIPAMRNNAAGKMPSFLGPRKYVSFNDDANYASALDELCDELCGRTPEKPPLRESFSGSPPSATVAGTTGPTPRNVTLLDDAWFKDRLDTAKIGIAKLKLPGAMELRFGLHKPVSKSQIELLRSIENSEIKTFGWPIGLTMNAEEYKPRPFADGVRAEVAIDKTSSIMNRDSYDYWAAKNNGDFFLLQSLFEDARRPGHIFFNTRIVRVTEALMFMRNYYKNLGAPDDAEVSVRIAHTGLHDRKLESSSHNRLLSTSPTSKVDEAAADATFKLDSLDQQLSNQVQQLLAPMFTLFEFTEINTAVYDDIVSRFAAGEVS